MARPTKQGIDYFPVDCNFDDKTELYLLEKEANGLAVMVTLFQIIYNNEGYYIPYTKDVSLLIKKRINVDVNEVNSCINSLIDRDILNKKMFNSYNILTSSGIQKRFFDAAKKKKAINFIDKFMLIDVSGYENLINVGINSIDSGIYPQTKRKPKEKEKEKVKENQNQSETQKMVSGLVRHFTKLPGKNGELPQPQKSLAFLLQKRGFKKQVADNLACKQSPEYLLRTLIQFDFEMHSKNIDNPQGYLFKLITDQDYAPTEDFENYYRGFKNNNDLPDELKVLL